MAIGQDPKEPPLAVVNYENNGEPCHESFYTKECPITLGQMGLPSTNEHLANFTCRYLSFLDSNIATPVYFNNESAALKAVEDGHAWGVVRLDEEFTKSLYERIFETTTNSDLKSIDKVSISPTFYDQLFRYRSVFCSFSVLTVWVCNFLAKGNWRKS